MIPEMPNHRINTESTQVVHNSSQKLSFPIGIPQRFVIITVTTMATLLNECVSQSKYQRAPMSHQFKLNLPNRLLSVVEVYELYLGAPSQCQCMKWKSTFGTDGSQVTLRFLCNEQKYHCQTMPGF